MAGQLYMEDKSEPLVVCFPSSTQETVPPQTEDKERKRKQDGPIKTMWCTREGEGEERVNDEAEEDVLWRESDAEATKDILYFFDFWKKLLRKTFLLGFLTTTEDSGILMK